MGREVAKRQAKGEESAVRPVPRNVRVRVAPSQKASRARATVSLGEARARVLRGWARVRRPAVIVLRALAVAAAVAGAVAMGRLLTVHLTTSKAFAIDRLEVEGLERLERDELLEAAGIDVGTNVFMRSPEQVKRRLLAHPWIASAEVSRRLPGQFSIRVREREPVALLSAEACPEPYADDASAACDEGPNGSIYLVSDEGTVFKRLEGEDPVDLPVITGVDRNRLATDPEVKAHVLLEAVALMSAYREAGLWRRVPIGEIHIEPGDAFSLYVGDDLTLIRLGQPPFGEKLKRMRKVFDRLAKEDARAEYVYLDNEQRPDRVTVRLR